MVSAIAVWSSTLVPGETSEIQPVVDLRITNIALGEEIADPNSRTSIRLVYTAPYNVDSDDSDAEDKQDAPIATILASLTPGKIEHASVDIILNADSSYLLETIGKNTIYITGNYIDSQGPEDRDLTPSEFDSDEDELDLHDVSSDVEFEGEELGLEEDDEDDSGRFEEIVDVAPKSPKSEGKGQKRAAQEMDVDGGNEEKSNKKDKKKRKGEDGKAITVPVESAQTTPAKPVGTDDSKKEVTSKKSDKKESKKESKKAVETELPGGLKIKDTKAGEGKVAKQGSTISMRYIGKLTNGQVFDKNVKGKPFTFRLGAGEVIKGWDQGIAGMQAGGERVLTIPPALAYGKQKQQGIPANSTLIFEVKCVDVK